MRATSSASPGPRPPHLLGGPRLARAVARTLVQSAHVCSRTLSVPGAGLDQWEGHWEGVAEATGDPKHPHGFGSLRELVTLHWVLAGDGLRRGRVG